MRSLRAVKYRKKYKKLVILAQILAIWYAVVISAAVLTSDTFAFFSSSSQSKISISTGEWWDGSKLAFIGEPNTENIKACAPYEISIQIKNMGTKMIGPTDFEIYYIKNGNPKQNGELVSDGIIEPMDEGETITLTYEATENGSYKFKVYQRPGYAENYEERVELWSKKFMVKCIDDVDVDGEEELVEEGTTQEVDEEVGEPVVNDKDTIITTDGQLETGESPEEAAKIEKKEQGKKESLNEIQLEEAKDKGKEDQKNIDSNKGKKDESEEVIKINSLKEETEIIEEGDE